MTQERIGYQDISTLPDDLRGRLSASPTGRQLASDGSHVLAVYTQDPASVLLSPPDGTEVLWEDSNTGVRQICSFLRATGWKYVEQT